MSEPASPPKSARPRRATSLALGLAVTLATFVVYVVLVRRTANVLTGDELFYDTIALAFRKGRLLAVDKSPPLLPLLLAALPTSDVRTFRGANALLCAVDVGLLFLLARDVFGSAVAVLAAALLGVSKFWVQYGVQLYAEPLFELWVLVAFILVLRGGPVMTLRRSVVVGAVLGLAVMAKPVGVVALAYVAVAAFVRELRAKQRVSPAGVAKVAVIVAAALVVAAPALVLGQARFVRDSTLSDTARRIAFFALGAHLTLPAVALYLGSLAFVLGSRERRARLTSAQACLVLFPVLWLVAMLAPPAYHFTRHDYPALPFFWLTCALPLAGPLAPRTAIGRGAFGLLAFAALAANVRRLPDLPRYSPNVYYLTPPPGCVEVKTWRDARGDVVTPPVFDQRVQSTETYVGVFQVSESAWYRYLYLSFVDDAITALEIDGEPTPFAGHGSFLPTVVRLHPGALHPDRESHELGLTIYNGATMGGFGQALFCTKMPLFHSEGGIPDAELF